MTRKQDERATWLLDVRRLAAVDMYGTRGTRRRRRIIAAEFVLGVVGCLVVGVLICLHSHSLMSTVVGTWVMGVGLNYIPLAIHAVRLLPENRLRTELEGVDVLPELRRYGLKQLWLVIPGLLVILDLAQRGPTARDPGG
jgi:hypothetical protein